MPIIDIAYQGPGVGLEQDAAGFRRASQMSKRPSWPSPAIPLRPLNLDCYVDLDKHRYSVMASSARRWKRAANGLPALMHETRSQHWRWAAPRE